MRPEVARGWSSPLAALGHLRTCGNEEPNYRGNGSLCVNRAQTGGEWGQPHPETHLWLATGSLEWRNVDWVDTDLWARGGESQVR
jgi:hypothetical protein